jgi:phospholipase/carboxylesterase
VIVPDLPRRPGRAPLATTSGTVEQLTQSSPSHLSERMRQRAEELPGVRIRPSFICVAGSSSCQLAPSLAHGPVEAFFAGTEFAHIHPSYDGSLHLMLPAAAAAVTIERGWGLTAEPLDSVLVYGPRDDWEFDIVWLLLQTAYQQACQEPEPTS